MEFRILGSFEVIAAGEAIELRGSHRRAVLALLVVTAPHPVSSERLIDALWGEQPPPTAKHAVHVHISALRKVIGDALCSVSAGYALEISDDDIDARRFERRVSEALRIMEANPTRASELLATALALWRGVALADLEMFDFARQEASRLDELRVMAKETLLQARLEAGQHSEVVGELSQLVAADRLRERSCRLLMLALYRCGRHAEALAVYRETSAALLEIGLQPGPELRELEAAMLRHASTGAVPAVRRGALPVPAHRLVGRRSELSALSALLGQEEVRLLTLLGPGGSGKTRLALEVARGLAARYEDGAWFVSLGSLADPALVASTIARTLGVREPEGQALLDALARTLESRHLLLVVDNFEHVIEAAPLLSGLLTLAPRVDILVTSREALRLASEHRFELGGLTLDDATELFWARARAVRRDLNDDADARRAAAKICRRLDGLPLALELAAARVAVFAVPALASRLELSTGGRDLPARQRTLRATIEWSYRLLTTAEQSLFCRLSVFAGGARMDLIEALPDASVDVVGGLVDKSLLRRRDDPDGMPRLWMLTTIREHALELLAARGEAEEVAAAHAALFLALAKEAEPQLHALTQGTWLSRLELEHDNLRAAFDVLVEHAPADALQMASALGTFWSTHGHLSEGRDRLRRALAARPASRTAAAAKTALHAGRLAYLQGATTDAEPLYEHSLRIARDAGETRTEVLALAGLGVLANGQGDTQRGVDLSEAAVRVARSTSDVWLLAMALSYLGTVKGWQRPDGGRTLFEEALAHFRALGDSRGIAMTAANLASLALAERDVAAADALLEEASGHADAIGYTTGTGLILCERALLAHYRGERDAANALMHEALDAARSRHDVQLTGTALAVAATLATEREQPLRAASLWAALENLQRRQPINENWLLVRLRERGAPRARHALDAAAWDEAWSKGSALGPETALELAAR